MPPASTCLCSEMSNFITSITAYVSAWTISVPGEILSLFVQLCTSPRLQMEQQNFIKGILTFLLS